MAHEVARAHRQSRLRLSYFTSTYQSHRLLVLEAHDLDRFDFMMISIQTGKHSALCRCDRNFGEREVGLRGRYLNMYATLGLQRQRLLSGGGRLASEISKSDGIGRD